MVVVPVGGGAGAGGWGTWEELVLGGAVLRHGSTAWAAVADELRSRSPCAFSPEDCEVKFAEIQSRYSACNAWFEELRKQRVAELKRELEKSENSIGSLQSVIESLVNSKHGDGSSDCHNTHTESCSHSRSLGDTNSSSKELSRNRSSVDSYNDEAKNCQKSQQVQRCETYSIQTNNTTTDEVSLKANCQKSQQVQRCDTDSIQTKNTSIDKSFLEAIDEKVHPKPAPKDSLFWGARKQRGGRVRRVSQKADASSRNDATTSTAYLEINNSLKGCKEDMKKTLNLKAPNVGSRAVKKGLKTSNVESDMMKKGLKAPNVESRVMKKGLMTSGVESGVSKKGLETPKLQPGVIKNGSKTPKVEPGVMKNSSKTPKVEPGVVKNSLKTPKVEPGVVKNSLKAPKVEPGVTKNSLKTPQGESGVMKNSLKTPHGESGVTVIEGAKANLADIVKFMSTQGDCLMLQQRVDVQRKRVTYKKMIRQHMDFRILRAKIKSGEISSTKELLRDMLLFANNVIAFYPKATLEHMAAVELRELACKTVNPNVNFVSKTASGPTVKKNAQVTQLGRRGPTDANGNKVPFRDVSANARQREGKGTLSDKPPSANLKTVQKSEPAKKRGVGRPPKSVPLKRSAPEAEDSPSRGRKRIRRGP